MIYLTGDIHGNPTRLSAKNTRNITSNDIVIILGDFGIFFAYKQTKEEKYWLDWLNDKPWMTLFLDGNHENFDRLDALEEGKMFGGKIGRVDTAIFHLKRGEIYDIDGSKFFIFGGGNSIDKHLRITGLTWWDRELPNFAEYKNGLDNLERHNHEVDYVLTHDAPGSVYKAMDKKYNLVKIGEHDLPKYFDQVAKEVSFQRWYFGHFHFDETFDERFTCLYEKVIPLGEQI